MPLLPEDAAAARGDNEDGIEELKARAPEMASHGDSPHTFSTQHTV